MRNSPVYIAGVGISHLQTTRSSAAIDDLIQSAGTKALLDAGVTYGDVKQSVACFLDNDLRVPRTSFDTYGKTGTLVCEINCYSGLFATSQFVQSGHANCAMMIGFDRVRSATQCIEQYCWPSILTWNIRSTIDKTQAKIKYDSIYVTNSCL